MSGGYSNGQQHKKPELGNYGGKKVFSQFQLVGDFRCDLLESDGGAGDAFEPDPVEWEPGQLANLDLPLDKRVGVGVAVNAEQQEPLPLLVITIVGIQNLQQQNRNSNELEGW